MPYTRYHGGSSFIELKAGVSEPIAQGTNSTIRVRNQTGHIMTITGLQGFCTLAGNVGTVDLQNAVAASHLAAVLPLVAGQVASTTTITGAAGTTKIDGADFYVVFNNPGGGANFITNAQATITGFVQWAST